MSKWTSVDEYHWRLGRYFVNRALAYDLNPIGHWVYLGAFKAHEGAAPDLAHRGIQRAAGPASS